MISCDIIMPVHNNARVLPATLEALFNQHFSAPWQIQLIASDDHSQDESLHILQTAASAAPWPVQILSNPGQGSAAARNCALRAAQADIILFLGADILLRPQALAAHLDFHHTHPAADTGALGFISWDPRLQPTPLMEWMMHGGPQNDFDALLGHTLADPRHFFYGANLSLKRALLLHNKFDQLFSSYGWEDLDLGRRLQAQGFMLHVLPTAHALHHHYYTTKAVRRRQFLSGYNITNYQDNHPSEHIYQPGPWWKQWVRRLAIRGGVLTLLTLATEAANWYNRSYPRLFQRFASLAFWAGHLSYNTQLGSGTKKRVKVINK